MQFGMKSNKLATTSNKTSRILRGAWWKDLLMTFIATTFSIVLTFGTAAYIDKKQKEKNKRQMAMYVLYDMNRSLEPIENNDSILRKGLELQISVARDTSLFEKMKYVFNHYLQFERFDQTTAQIFSSNFETLKTLDNVVFVEIISTFYRNRDMYEDYIIDSCQNEYKRDVQHWDVETALGYPYSYYVFISGSILDGMKNDFQRCKELMGVSDEELAAFELKERSHGDSKTSADDTKEKFMKEFIENNIRLESSIEEGKSGDKQSE